MRSMMRPTEMMDARIRNQIGQPAASTIANTKILHLCLNYQAATLACHTQLSNLSHELLQQNYANLSSVKEYFLLPTKPVDNFVDKHHEKRFDSLWNKDFCYFAYKMKH